MLEKACKWSLCFKKNHMALSLAFRALYRLVHVHGTILFDLFVLLANICKLNIVKKNGSGRSCLYAKNKSFNHC